MSGSWRWELRDASGAIVPCEKDAVFTNRFDAEAWLGERWRTLGAATAQLCHGDEAVGAAVALREPDA